MSDQVPTGAGKRRPLGVAEGPVADIGSVFARPAAVTLMYYLPRRQCFIIGRMVHSAQVPEEIMQKWQEIVDLLADIVHVPSALIMRVEPPNIKVLVSSESQGNPYEPGEAAALNTGL